MIMDTQYIYTLSFGLACNVAGSYDVVINKLQEAIMMLFLILRKNITKERWFFCWSIVLFTKLISYIVYMAFVTEKLLSRGK